MIGDMDSRLCPWSAPFKVLKKLSEVTYRIFCCQGGRKRMVVHFNRLKLHPANLRSQLQSSQDSTHYQVDDVASHPERSGSAGAGMWRGGFYCRHI